MTVLVVKERARVINKKMMGDIIEFQRREVNGIMMEEEERSERGLS